MNYLIGAAAFVFVLGAAVVLHEFGHFAVAKLLKIRVETFSIGFGPRLWGKKWGTTDYRISAIPLGGYVKLGGDESNAPIEGDGADDIPPEEQFSLRPRWQKIAVAVAGPVMNIATALAIPFSMALLYGVPPVPQPLVQLVPAGGVSDTAGLKPGDRIVSFNGIENENSEQMLNDAALNPGLPIHMIVERSGQRIPLTIVPSKQTKGTETLGEVDFTLYEGKFPVIINGVNADSPAERAGLQKDDIISALDGVDAENQAQVRAYIKTHTVDPIDLTVKRNGAPVHVSAKVGPIGDGNLGLGITLRDVRPEIRVGLGDASRYAVNFNLEILRVSKYAFAQVFQGNRKIGNTVSGPIGIARMAATSANDWGWDGVFGVLGLVSLSLGITNLLPVPVLDGGAIFLNIIEGILALAGLALSLTVRERIQQFGFVVLLLLIGFVITNDLIKEGTAFFGSGDKSAVHSK